MAVLIDLSARQPPSVVSEEDVPEEVRSGRWLVTFTSPTDSATRFAGTSGNANLFGFGDGSGNQGWISIFGSGGAGRIQVVTGYVVGVGATGLYETTTGITFSAGQPITLSVDTVAATLTVSGATAGNQTISLGTGPIQLPGGPLYVGQTSLGSLVFDGTLSNIVSRADYLRGIDGLDDSNYYTIASPGCSRGTLDTGDMHVAAWVTLKPTTVSKVRRIYGTEGPSGGTPYGLSIITQATNSTIQVRTRGTTNVEAANVAVTAAQVGRPLYVVGVISGGTLRLYLDGALVDTRALGATGYFAISTSDATIGRRPPSGTDGDGVAGAVVVHGLSMGNTVPTDLEIAQAASAGILAGDIVAIGGGKTEHLYSALLATAANSSFLDRVGTDHFTRVGLPTYYEEWAALDELTDANYYTQANPLGSRGTTEVGNVHCAAWITLQSMSVASQARNIYSIEGSLTDGHAVGYALHLSNANTRINMRSRGASGVTTAYVDLDENWLGRPHYLVGAIGGGFVRLYIDGELAHEIALPATGHFDVTAGPVALGRRPPGTGTDGNSCTGDVKVHGVSHGNTVPTAAEVAAAYAAGLAAQDITTLGGSKTEHLYSARRDGAAGSALVDRAGSEDMTRVGQPAYVSPMIVSRVEGVNIFPAFGAATVLVASSLTASASFDPLECAVTVETGADMTISASFGAMTADAFAFAGGLPFTVYAQRGTQAEGENGEIIPDTGATVSFTEFIRNRLYLGPIRTDNSRNYQVIDEPTVSVSSIAASFAPMTASVALPVGVGVALAASMATLGGSATVVNPTNSAAIAASFPSFVGSATVTATPVDGGGLTIKEPFAVGSHTNERARYAQLAAAGVKWLRNDISWYHVEPSRGTYSWGNVDLAVNEAVRVGLKLHIILGYTPTWASGVADTVAGKNQYSMREEFNDEFVNYVQATVSRYGDRVASWEIWNEPNHANLLKIPAGCWARNRFPGESAVNIKRLEYERIQQLALSAPALAGKVVTTSGWANGGSGFDTGFVNWCESRPNFFARYDVCNYHCYGYPGTVPNSAVATGAGYDLLINDSNSFRAQGVRIGKPNWPRWITEHGLRRLDVDDNTTKRFLIRSYAVALGMGVERMFWFHAGWTGDHQDFFDTGSNPRVPYYTFQVLTQMWVEPTSFTPWSSGTARGTVATRNARNRMLIAWADSSGAAINSYGLNIVSVRNQDGNTISSGSTLTSQPVFIELGD